MDTKRDWAWLPELVLDSIIKRLIRSADCVRFAAVCKHWFSVAILQNMSRKSCPMLLIPTKDSSKEKRGLYDAIHGKISTVELPIPFNRRCCGSSHGWLAFAMHDLVISLFNPFLRKQIDLPRLLNLVPHYEAQYYVTKVVLSADPFTNPDDYEVVAIYGDMKELAFIRAGQETWTHIPVGKSIKKLFCASDVIYDHQGIMYAVNNHNRASPGKVVRINTAARSIKTVAQWNENSSAETNLESATSYLVESSGGELLVVNRLQLHQYHEPEISSLTWEEDSFRSTSEFKTSKFKIRKIGTDRKKLEVFDLGEDALFLGDNQSMSILASDIPGCRPNSIYFTDDYMEFYYPHGPRDMAIFNLKDQTFECHYVPNPLHKSMPPPIWITPIPAMSTPLTIQHSADK